MERLVLAALADRQRFKTLRRAVPEQMLGQETSVMLQWYGVYFEAFPEHKSIDVDALQSLIKLRSGAASAEQIAVTMRLANELRNPVDPVAIKGILGQLHELDLAGQAGAIITRYNEGAEVNLAYELNKLSTQAVRNISQSSPSDYIDTPIGELLADISNDKGIKFKSLNLLRENVAGMHGGASIAIAMRPDKGKTSLIACALADFAPQIHEYFGPDRPILWLNNEGSGKRIIPRVYQAVLKQDLNGIIALSNMGELTAAYTAAVGGVPDMIRVKDMHGASLPQIEQVIEAMRPSVVVFDMVANFRLGGSANGANKADMIEQLWQEIREMAVRHDFISLGTVQISAEGGNQLFPPYSALKDSKTGIQGATDLIIMGGSLDSPDYQTVRGISTPKNKFAIAGKQSYIQGQVYFDAARCVFSDGETVAVPT